MALQLSLLLAILVPWGTQDTIRRGMKPDDVRQRLGAPSSISRQILQGRYVEQWHYQKAAVWIDFDGVKGQEPRVRSVHPSAGELD